MRRGAILLPALSAAIAVVLTFGTATSATAGVIGPWTMEKPAVVGFRAGGASMKLVATHRGTATEVIDRYWKTKAYVHWRVQIVSAGHVRYSSKMTWTRLTIVQRIFANAPQMDSVPHRQGLAWVNKFSAAEFRRILHHLDEASTAQLDTEIKAYQHEAGAEDAAMYGRNGDLCYAATRWAKRHGYPKTFDGFDMPTSTTTTLTTPVETTYRLTGTTRRVVATATLPNGLWVRLTGLRVKGVLGDYPSS